MRPTNLPRIGMLAWLGFFLLCATLTRAAPLPGGTLDPLTIPKYQTPLVIPPVMPNDGTANSYDIAVREFRQQILPAGFPSTKVWGYGAAADPIPGVAPAANSSFNYPAFTIETTADVAVNVRWLNELVTLDPTTGKPCDGVACQPAYLPHLFDVDQTLHWANPAATGCVDGTNRTDCATLNPAPYLGPVPIVTHLHGAHVEGHSDGFPEAWWLPAASDLPETYATKGTLFADATGTNPGNTGYADYAYRNDQPATTLWYHDHTLGMTRLNVYAGPAGFWLVRDGAHGDAEVDDGRTALIGDGTLPGPPPTVGQDVNNFTPDSVRNRIREIPVLIQDRSFNADGSLFYPTTRAFFDGFMGPYVPDSDIAPIWNPEVFFNTMVVNGSTWPTLDVAPAAYRFRLLNGCNSRTLNLALPLITLQGGGIKQKDKFKAIQEIPFYQIGADQGFLPQVVMIQTGFATPLAGTGAIPAPVPTADPARALLLGPAERADVIVDFTGLPDGTIVRMVNTGPDEPFGHLLAATADPATTGQVMQFVVRTALLNAAGSTDGATTPPQHLLLPAESPLATVDATRQLSLNEEGSTQVCVQVTPSGRIRVLFTAEANDPNFLANCIAMHGEPMAPKAAKLGTFAANPDAGIPTPLMWSDFITENPALNSTEEWEIFNLTEDTHPIHLHLVRFQVINRQPIDPLTFLPVIGTVTPPEASETGYKDTVLAPPGQVTRVKALFDIEGLYVWHCHILEHEDNEMMRPYYVGPAANSPIPVAGSGGM